MSPVDRLLPARACRRALLACLILSVLLSGVSAPLRAEDPDIPVNQGGVLVVHDHGLVPADTDTACRRLDLLDWKDARVEAAVEGETRLIGVYAAFAPGDSVLVAGITFGVHYTPTVTVLARGACGNKGMEVLSPGFPGDRTGVASILLPYATTALTPIYWFLVKTTGPGWFEVTPNPLPQHGGMFGSGHPAPRSTPITGYGRLGFGTPGTLPEPGTAMELGGCCVEECARLSPLDCAWFTGIWLGEDADCAADPCDAGAATGACCLGVECVVETRLDCVIQGGEFLGEGTPCDGVDCMEAVDVGRN